MAFTPPLSGEYYDPAQFDSLPWLSPSYTPTSDDEALEQGPASSYFSEQNEDAQLGQLGSALQSDQQEISSLEQQLSTDQRELSAFERSAGSEEDEMPTWQRARPIYPQTTSPLPAL